MLNADSIADVLSPQQREVLALSATGLITAEVAAVLRAPVEEIRARLTSAIVELGATSKLEAVLIALRRGLIHVPNN
jgi:DNA-binding CsgD family transcriptional regulator